MLFFKKLEREKKNHNSTLTHDRMTETRSHPHNPFKPAQAFLIDTPPPRSYRAAPH